jgi:hypothetical protein
VPARFIGTAISDVRATLLSCHQCQSPLHWPQAPCRRRKQVCRPPVVLDVLGSMKYCPWLVLMYLDRPSQTNSARLDPLCPLTCPLLFTGLMVTLLTSRAASAPALLCPALVTYSHCLFTLHDFIFAVECKAIVYFFGTIWSIALLALARVAVVDVWK